MNRKDKVEAKVKVEEEKVKRAIDAVIEKNLEAFKELGRC